MANKVKYDNCMIVNPQGERVFKCDEEKANWYILNNHGKKLTDIPLTVQLLYDQEEAEVKFEGCEELYGHACYWQMDLENICAVCKTDKYLSRYYAVPVLYKNSLPHNMKTWCASDKILLCQMCNDRAHRFQDSMKYALADSFDINLTDQTKL